MQRSRVATARPANGINETVMSGCANLDMCLRRRIAPLLLAPLLVFAAHAASAQTARESAWRQVHERWYTIEINDQQAGWAAEILFDDGARYKTVSDQAITVARGESDVATVAISIASIETHAGAPVEIRQLRRLGQEPAETTWTFAEGRIERTVIQNGRESRAVETLDSGGEPWLMPHAAEVFEQAQRAAGADHIEYRTIDSSAGLRIIAVSQRRTGEATFQSEEGALPVEVWTVKESTLGGTALSETVVHVASDGAIVFAQEAAGAMKFTTRSTSRVQAQQALRAPPELLEQTVVRPSRRITGAAKAVAATYRLRVRVGELPPFPSAGAQRAQQADDGTMLVTIDTRESQPAGEEEADDARYLEANATADCGDPLVAEMARAVVSRLSDPTPAAKAEALRRAVVRHITNKGLASAFASASETIRSRGGDCSEHAVLLCALLRAEGIPARVASGLVYADSFAGQRNVFAWHMWTQALVDGLWIDLDATSDGPFHAAHILASVTDLAGGGLSDELTRIVGLMGNLDIEVISVEHR